MPKVQPKTIHIKFKSPPPPQPEPFGVDQDQYHIPASKIPKGSSYQWIAVDLNGEPLAGYSRSDRSDSGWKRVPPKRHPNLPTKDGAIVFNGLMLCERPLSVTQAAADIECRKANEMMEYGRVPFTAATPNTFRTDFPVVAEELATPSDGKPVEVTIQIGFLLSAHLAEVAAYLRLTPTEYARRRVLLLARGEPGILAPVPGSELFEICQLQLVREK